MNEPVRDAATSEGPSAIAARLLPYGFAKAGQILVAQQDGEAIEVWISDRTTDAALAEVA
ncbi:type II secretion system protein GspE, partial [Burkholderia gladioli]|nr:type II secretion system protein GspE [Burkholderia gladioli]